MKLFSEDQGARPAQGAAENSISVADAADPSAKPIRLVPGRDYRVQVTIWNLGRAPVVFGLAEYYALGHSQLEGFGASLTAKPAGIVDFQMFIDYIKSLDKVNPTIEGRITTVGN